MNIKILKKIGNKKTTHIFYENEKGEVIIEPNTPYFRHKIIVNKNERIFHEMPEHGIVIQETFNDMIFNITLNGSVITTRPNMADEVIRAFNDPEKVEHIFNKYNQTKFNIDLLKTILTKYGNRIKIVDEGFIIDDIFLVDRNGVAYNWNGKSKNTSKSTNLSNGGICIVVNKVSRQKIVDPITKQVIELDPHGYTILAKIQFLLSPNLEDRVFVGQLPKETLEILKRQDEKIINEFFL
jgi:hypothetical protein